MQVKYRYYPIQETQKDKTTPLIPACCKEPSPTDPGCSDCCYDEWKNQLNEVNQTYEMAAETADIMQKRIAFLTDRRNRFRKWHEEILTASEQLGDLCAQFEVIISHTQKLWFNTCKANDAVKTLFCMIRKFYLEIDYVKCRYDELTACITGSADPALKEDKGIISCLKNFGAALDAVIKARDELLKQIIEAVKLAQVLRNNMNTACCLPDDYNHCKEPDNGKKPVLCENKTDTPDANLVYGFKSVVCFWYSLFNCGVDCLPGTLPAPPPPPVPEEPYKPCAEDCELSPQFNFPLCNDYYRQCVSNWAADDDAKLKKLSKDIIVLNKSKEGLLACQASLTKAMEETDPKLRCS